MIRMMCNQYLLIEWLSMRKCFLIRYSIIYTHSTNDYLGVVEFSKCNQIKSSDVCCSEN